MCGFWVLGVLRRVYYNITMDSTRDNERKPLLGICWVMVGVLAVLLGVIAWQLWQRQQTPIEEVLQSAHDEVAPILTDYLEEVELTAGTAFDFLNYAQAVDETDGVVRVAVRGDYNLGLPGEHSLQYVARDQSGNEVVREFLLRVVEGEAGAVRILGRTFMTDRGFQARTEGGVTMVDGVLIANKSYGLPEDYGEALTAETLAAFEEMQAAAAAEGLNLQIVSGFRTYATQANLYTRYVRRDGAAEAETYSARPGFSEHQTGLAMDINMADSSFAETPEGRWLAEHAAEYGFILRYPEGKSEVTGYIFEPWHFRYVGRDLAEQLYNQGEWLSLEEYFGLTSEYGVI